MAVKLDALGGALRPGRARECIGYEALLERARTGLRASPLALALAAGLCASLPAASAAAPTGAWSAPVVLGQCVLATAPRVAFPSASPTTPTGPGAIIWAFDRRDCNSSSGSSGQVRWGLTVAPIGAGDRTTAPRTVSLGEPVAAGLQAVGGSQGHTMIVAALHIPGTAAGPITAVLQGRVTRSLGAPTLLAGSSVPSGLARGYLGDVVLATTAHRARIAVRVQRYFRSGFARARLLPIALGRVTALTATMDYRSDVLIAWQQNGAVYARMLHASGRADPIQRVGVSAPEPQLQALVSDNGHGMIAWSTTESRGSSLPRTRIYLDLSGPDVRFGPPRLLASFPDPQRVGRSPGSLDLVRLSTENVVLAWTEVEHGHYVVRAAPAVFAGRRRATLLSDVGSQAVLADLAAGSAGEAVALWKRAPRRGNDFDLRRTELWAARVFIEPHDRLALQVPQEIAPSGPNVDPSVAVDPGDDHAVAAWLTLGAHRDVEYAVGPGAVEYRPTPTARAALTMSAGTHWLRISAAVATMGLAAVLAGVILWRRRHAGP